MLFLSRCIQRSSNTILYIVTHLPARESYENIREIRSKDAELWYAPLAPYYLIANGGCLSDEYELLSYAKAVEENSSFQERMQAEELLDEQPEGIVIAVCPDGDAILRCSDGIVVRFSHEASGVIEQWPSLPQFIANSIQDCE